MRPTKGSGRTKSKKAPKAAAVKRGTNAAAKKPEAGEGHESQKPVAFERIRRSIKEKVGQESEEIVAGLIEEAKHNCTPAKYLFDMIGLYPAKVGEEQAGGETMVSALLQRLGVTEEIVEIEEEEESEPAGTVK